MTYIKYVVLSKPKEIDIDTLDMKYANQMELAQSTNEEFGILLSALREVGFVELLDVYYK